jgi:hypothetical protein
MFCRSPAELFLLRFATKNRRDAAAPCSLVFISAPLKVHLVASHCTNGPSASAFESLRSLHFFLGFFPPPIILHFRRGSFGAALPKSYLERTCGLDGSFVCKILRRVFAHPRDLACAIPGSHMRGETQGQLVFPLLGRVAGFLFRG